MDIRDLEEMLGARYIDSYSSGHMGSQILRFQHNVKGKLVVKFAPASNKEAIADIEANIHGYNQIRLLAGLSLIPPDLREMKVPNGKALVMRDLGSSIRTANSGLNACVLFWEHFKLVILKTISKSNNNGKIPLFVVEVVEFIEQFSNENTQRLLQLILNSDWINEKSAQAIMLLDFTPDNLFVNETSLSFIDPWRQDTYLGHPAVSLGQFATLVELYKMKDAERIAFILKRCYMVEISSMLGCSAAVSERAFRLGSTLQFILSSYVRYKSNPALAAELIEKAYRLWR